MLFLLHIYHVQEALHAIHLTLMSALLTDSICRLCLQLCSIFRVPIAIVSLVDTERQWFKSAQGLPGVQETSRATSFCAWTLLPKNPEVLIVTDATQDER